MTEKKKDQNSPLGLVPPGSGKKTPAPTGQSPLPQLTTENLITMIGAKDVDLNMTRAQLQNAVTANNNLGVDNDRLKKQLKKVQDELKKQLKKESKKK